MDNTDLSEEWVEEMQGCERAFKYPTKQVDKRP
jgi:hypothetical protein